MFEYTRQPLKALYLVCVVLSVVARLPLWTVKALLPATRPRKSWPVYRTILVWSIDAFVASWFKTGFPHEPLEEDDPGFVWIEPIHEEWILGEIKDLAETNGVEPVRVHGYWRGNGLGDDRSALTRHAEPQEKILYYLHGGGYVMGTANGKTTLASSPYSLSVPAHAPKIFKRSFALGYRLSAAAPLEPKNPFPASLFDALAGYRYLVEDAGFQPKDIIVCGDSAGGHLALVLTRYLIAYPIPKLDVPGGLMLMSPTSDWGRTYDNGNPKSSAVVHRNTDYVYEIVKNGYAGRSIAGSLPPEVLDTNSWFSPSSLHLKETDGLFKGFPPTLINCGGAEMARDEKRTLRDRMIRDCGQDTVTYLEYEDAVHDFILVTFFEPERTRGLDDIRNWLQKITATK
ncbi:alpha/beta-hydrolase [Cristinia sonorae]|uniref:Alpha/beta-hydrolase n=1 Tax=Cristinia sonorae TaxID=1940300 RepID=A0A8K0UHT1_9AGAR|nr:alpha/beta-hydrolase [Cristinia sonorae]